VPGAGQRHLAVCAWQSIRSQGAGRGPAAPGPLPPPPL